MKTTMTTKNAYAKYHKTVLLYVEDSQVFNMFERIQTIKDDEERELEIEVLLDFTKIPTIAEVEDYVKNMPAENRVEEQTIINQIFNNEDTQYSYVECMEHMIRNSEYDANFKRIEDPYNNPFDEIERLKKESQMLREQQELLMKKFDEYMNNINDRAERLELNEQHRREDEAYERRFDEEVMRAKGRKLRMMKRSPFDKFQKLALV